jgi:hypothetical protein
MDRSITDARQPQAASVVESVMSSEPSAAAEEVPPLGAVEVVADAASPTETSWGGLLFLIHLIRGLHIPERHAESRLGDALSRRSLHWLLHQLALRLAPIAIDDPAALAFVGLAPDARLPNADAPPPTDEERAALDLLIRELDEGLWARFPAIEPAMVRESVCRRTATIEADAGWIVARFAADEVRTDVRRAGLDLDPGWLPFLGVVLRFVYE